ncbi:hypothetical protein PanWU01x14_178700, partial [Parasponia andersonii]
REKERVRENRATTGGIPCSFMAAEGEIPMTVDVQSKRRKVSSGLSAHLSLGIKKCPQIGSFNRLH